jgi:hypothetical protein
VTTNEDTTYIFTTGNFGFTDPNDTPANNLSAVKITTLASDGKLKLSGVDVTAGQFIPAASITAGNLTFVPDANENGSPYATFTFQVQDDGGTANGGVNLDQSANTMTINVLAVNDAPTGLSAVVAPTSISENDSATVSGSFTDPDVGDTHTVTINWGDGSANSVSTLTVGARSYSVMHQYKDDNPTGTPSDVNTITVTVTDSGQDLNPSTTADNTSVSQGTTITVANLPPAISTATGPTMPVAAGGSATVSATFTDVGTKDTHTCSIDWDDLSTTTGTVTETNGSGSCTATHTYATPGVYTVQVKITDDDTGSATKGIEPMFIIVFDPTAGFITGGGWIMSPAGACQLTPACTTQTGKANFGFVSKYKKGSNTPDGQTEFQFQAGDINFHSSEYDYGSLVVSGYKAQYKGSGEINGVGGYKFILTAYDGNIAGGGGADRFRMKITKDSVVIYDNKLGVSDTDDIDTLPMTISGGSIVIHK